MPPRARHRHGMLWDSTGKSGTTSRKPGTARETNCIRPRRVSALRAFARFRRRGIQSDFVGFPRFVVCSLCAPRSASRDAAAGAENRWRRVACKPGSVHARRFPLGRCATIPLDPSSPKGSRGQPGRRGGNAPASAVTRFAGRPYSALLPVGFAMPPPSPGARWALAPPFHPYRGVDCPRAIHLPWRSALCGTFPGV